MAITLAAIGGSTTSTSLAANGTLTSASFSTAGESLILVVAGSSHTSANSVSSVTIGGHAATRAKRQLMPDGLSNVDVWYYFSPSALSAATVVANYSNSAGALAFLNVTQAFGADANSIGNTGSANGTSGTSAASATCSASGSVMFSGSQNLGGTESAGTNTTRITATTASTLRGASAFNNQATSNGTSYTCTTTHTSAAWAMVVVEVKQAVLPGAPITGALLGSNKTLNNSTPGATGTVSVTPTPGSTICVFVTFDSSTGASISCADDSGDPGATAYTKPTPQTGSNPQNDATLGQSFGQFYFPNNSGSARTITVTWSPAAAFRGIVVGEMRNAASSGYDGSALRDQAGPGATVDATTTAAMSNATAPAGIMACSFNGTNAVDPPSAGSGCTSLDIDNVTLGYRLEWIRVTGTGTRSGTFTASSGTPTSDHYVSMGMIFDEAATLNEPFLGPPNQGPSVMPQPSEPSRLVKPWVPIANQVVTPLSWAPRRVAPVFPAPSDTNTGARRSLQPIATQTVVPLSWAPEFTLPDPPPVPMPPRAAAPGPPLPPPAPAVPPVVWKPIVAALPPPPPPPISARRFAAYAVTPPPPLSWAPEFTVPDPRPPVPVIGQAARPIAPPAAVTLPPLTWQPEINGPPDPAPAQTSSRVVAPVSPLVAPLLAWKGWQPPPPIAPTPQVGGGIVSPVAPLAVPVLAWLTVPPWTAPPPPAPVGGLMVGPLDPLAVPPLDWLSPWSWTAAPPPPPLGGGMDAPVAPLVAPPLAWLGVSAGAGVPALIGAPSLEVGPFPAILPVPALAWAPRVAAPPIPVPPPAFDASARSMLPIASQVLTPLAWAPNYRAPLAPAAGVPQSLVFGPVPPQVVPVIAWAPSWRVPPAPGPSPTAPATFNPVLPPSAPPALAWAAITARAAASLPQIGGAAAAGPLLPPALAPLLAWSSPSPASLIVAAPMPARPAGFGPILIPLPPAASWLLPRTAVPIRVEVLARATEVHPVVVPPPNVPPVLQPRGYTSAPLPAAWAVPQSLVFWVIFTPAQPVQPTLPLPPPFVVQLVDEDGPVNLTGATVTCRTQPASRSRLTSIEPADVVDPLHGIVRKTWTERDVRGVPTGDMLLQFVVVDQDGRPRTYPGAHHYYHQEITGRPR